MAKNGLNIAVIPGDGIGKEVIPEGLRVFQAAMERFDINLNFDYFDFASYDYYAKHGQMMPNDWKAQIGNHDAIYFGAVGWPDGIPDHISLWGSLILFRREFDQYVSLDSDINFLGEEKLKRVKSKGIQKKLMGVKINTKEISLTGSQNLYDKDNNIIGELRSACYSPHFKEVIGIAMIKKPFWESTQTFKIELNNNTFSGKVCDLPFI